MQPVIPDPQYGRGFRFGVFTPGGLSLGAFDHPWIGHTPDLGPAETLPGTHIYGGVLMNHFGHMLLESLSRVWFIRAHPDLPVVWHWLDLPVPHSAWPVWMEQLWAMLGLDRHRHVIIRNKLQLEQVIVPDHGIRPYERIEPVQAEALAVVAEGSSYAGQRVWLSRSALPRRFGRLIGEEGVQTALQEAGWSVVHPEKRPVAEQAALFNDAKIVAGFAGSAFHAVLLAKTPAAHLCIIRRPSVTDGYYDAAARARGLHQRMIDPPLAPYGPVNAWSTFSLTDPAVLATAVNRSLTNA